MQTRVRCGGQEREMTTRRYREETFACTLFDEYLGG